MENKPLPDSDFENMMRWQLEQLNAVPDDNTWDNIATRQSLHNGWLRLRHYGIFIAPVLLVLLTGLAVWWHYGQASSQLQPLPMSPALEQAAGTPVLPNTGAPDAEGMTLNEPAGEATLFSGKNVNTVPASIIHFRAEGGVHYQSPSTGTTVQILANSLVDENGVPAEGEVDLVLREYRSAADFLASGIPMHYADERGNYLFNSGGMFEVRVSQRGKSLKIKEGQTYQVTFSPTDQLTKASLYYFDETTSTWRYQPDPAFAAEKGGVPSDLPPVATEAEVLRDNRKGKGDDCLPEITELRSEQELAPALKEAIQTGYDLATENMPMPKWFRKNPGLTNEQLLNGLERGQIRIVQHKDQNELFFPEDLSNTFTELNAFKGCYFTRSIDSLNGGRGNARLHPEDRWQRITIAQEHGAYCQIALFGENTGWMQFYATLTNSIQNKSYDAEKVLAEYNRLRAERLDNFEARVAKLRNFLAVAPAFQTQEELCLEAAPAWLEYFEANHPMMAKRYGALLKAGFSTNDSLVVAAWETWQDRLRRIKRARYERLANARNKIASFEVSLKLKGFGTYNCDQIYRLGDPMEFVQVEYRTPEGGKIKPVFVSVMERSNQLFFTLPSVAGILNMPGRRLDFVLTDQDGRQYYLPGEKYASLNLDASQHNIVTVYDVTNPSRTPLEWAELLTI